jgi:hypothetical protein
MQGWRPPESHVRDLHDHPLSGRKRGASVENVLTLIEMLLRGFVRPRRTSENETGEADSRPAGEIDGGRLWRDHRPLRAKDSCCSPT